MTSLLAVAMMTTSLMLRDVTAAGNYAIRLEHMSSVTLPVHRESGGTEWRFNPGSVRSMALHAHTGVLYVVGGSDIQYINVSNPDQLDVISHTSVHDVTFYDVATCGDYVLATYTSSSNQSGLLVAKSYGAEYQLAVLKRQTIHDVTDPVSLAVTSDCSTVVVAIDGKASWHGGNFVDPEAAVVVVTLSAILSRDATDDDGVAVLDFRDFDDKSRELIQRGLHFPMEGRVGRLSQDLDPSDVTIDDVTRLAYVTMQVNNAVAVLDLDSRNITQIVPLGLKDWADLGIDLSDKDGARFQEQPIYSMYQPGAICIVRHSGAPYLLSANTGAKRDYSHMIQWKEDITGKEMVENDMVGNSVEPALKADLKDPLKMGNLHFTKVNGLDEQSSNTLTKFLIFGGRSFSLRRLSDLDLLTYDSGDDLEFRVAQNSRATFNLLPREGYNVVNFDRDLSSVTTGPGPSSVTTGSLGSLTLMAVGLANPGGVLLYSMRRGDSLDNTPPKFEHYWTGLAEWSLNNSWDQLYSFGSLNGIGVSDLIFIPSHVSKQRFPMILVAGSKSGTVSVLKVKGIGDVPYNSARGCQVVHTVTVLLSVLTTWMSVSR